MSLLFPYSDAKHFYHKGRRDPKSLPHQTRYAMTSYFLLNTINQVILGETEWTINGNHTSFTDLPLTANGEKQVTATGKLMIGHNKMIDPSRLAHVFVSPRIRAKRTLELAFGAQTKESLEAEGKITETEKITEWFVPAHAYDRVCKT